MFHARARWIGAPAFGGDLRAELATGRRSAGLVVDLGTDLFTRRWWRGAGTLALLCSATGFLAPGIEPLTIAPTTAVDLDSHQRHALGIGSLSAGSRTGLRMAATELVEPIDLAPDRAAIELTLRLAQAERLERVLSRAGASSADSVRAAALVRAGAPAGLAAGSEIAVTLGRKLPSGARPIERLELAAGIDARLTIARGADGELRLTRQAIAVDNSPLRFRGRIGDGFYWSLRTAGVSPQLAADYLKVLSSAIDVGADVGPDDRFDLVIANRRSASGESRAGPLLYAGIDRFGGSDLQLVRWTAAGRVQWIDASSIDRREAAAMTWPVAGRITSGFGYRIHPILRFARFHRGIDFGAPRGSPIVAAADGQVTGAGWAGGYGRQIRLAHGEGLATTYSHMSRIVAEPGSFVRQGELIGYVGSSGLSTGPHLHYEVYRDGRPVNPLSVRLANRPLLEGRQLDAFNARLKALLSVGTKAS